MRESNKKRNPQPLKIDNVIKIGNNYKYIIESFFKMKNGICKFRDEFFFIASQTDRCSHLPKDGVYYNCC